MDEDFNYQNQIYKVLVLTVSERCIIFVTNNTACMQRWMNLCNEPDVHNLLTQRLTLSIHLLLSLDPNHLCSSVCLLAPKFEHLYTACGITSLESGWQDMAALSCLQNESFNEQAEQRLRGHCY